MASIEDVCADLLRHKPILLREISDTSVLDVLVKKGIFSVSDLELIAGSVDSDKCNLFIEVVSKQSNNAKLSELYSVLQRECPKLWKEMMNDRNRILTNGFTISETTKDIMVMSHNLNRESPRSRRSISQCSCNSISRRSSAIPSPMPLPPLNNTVEMYVEPVVEDVTDIRSLKYDSAGQVFYKLRFRDEYTLLNQRRNKAIEKTPFENLPQLHTERRKITKKSI